MTAAMGTSRGTDGTEAGTALLKDIQPSVRTFDSNPDQLRPLGKQVLFVADDGLHGVELWRSDGSEAGTVLVKDIADGSSNPVLFEASGGALLFMANDGRNGRELWRTDGTGSGTYLLKDFSPGPGSSIIETVPTRVGQWILKVDVKAGCPKLWRSDGTAPGTVPVDDALCAYDLARMGGSVYFSGYRLSDGSIMDSGLWRTDGTTAGTTLVRSTEGLPYLMTGDERRLYFWQDSLDQFGPHTVMWTSDGTTDGTFVVREIDWGRHPEELPPPPVVAGGLLYFSPAGFNGFFSRSDGTIAGTFPLGTVNLVSSPTPVGDYLYFQTGGKPWFQIGGELRVTDGTLVRLLFDFRELKSYDQVILKLGHVDSTLLFGLFFVGDSWDSGLWRSDGTAGRTVEVQRFDGSVGAPVAVGRKVFFPAYDDVVGMELWVAPTSMLTGRAEDAILDLQADLQDLGLNKGITNSLAAKLSAAADALENGRRAPAVLSVEALIHEVEAQRGKAIPEQDADSLIELARELITLLG